MQVLRLQSPPRPQPAARPWRRARLLLAVLWALWWSAAPAAGQSFDVEMVVAQDGSGDFTTIQAAIDAAKAFPPERITIFVKNGVYREQVRVPAWNPLLSLVGESAEGTILTYDAHFDAVGRGRNSTFHTATLRVEADDFVARDLTVRNTAGPVGQAVALHVEGDRAVFERVRLLGHQDTVYLAGEGRRQYFRDCYVEGTTDFIFGGATAVFEDCEIHALRDSYITAASTPARVPFGFVFLDCRITTAPGVDAVYLGRPWRPHARTVFIGCELGPGVHPDGWHDWSKPDARATTYYAEYGSTGPGADRAARVPWAHALTDEDAARYTVEAIFAARPAPVDAAWYAQPRPRPAPAPVRTRAWDPNLDGGRYRNPIIHADYSDPDVVRVGDDFYMTASSFNAVPALPLLHSKDLVNWRLVNHAVDRLDGPAFPEGVFDVPQHGNGVWAPAIRHHEGTFYIFWGDPDHGIYMVKTRDPRGVWDEPVLVKAGKGLIDPAPLWDDDGRAYLVHAFAKSRAGFNSVLHVAPMSPDGTRLLGESREVFDGHADHPTIEGPKFYKRGGRYYLFAPAGGVKDGWQTVLRADDVYGPYEACIVLAQGDTDVNGPHQGAYVELDGGEGWFVHFQEHLAYGRIVHLQPVVWRDGWPVMGRDDDGDGTGEPVLEHARPDVGRTVPTMVPQTSDAFEAARLGLPWQWHANPQPGWYSLTDHAGALRLFAQPRPAGAANLWPVPNLLLQKLPAPAFAATARVTFRPGGIGETAGLVVMGTDHASLALRRTADGVELVQARALDARGGTPETDAATVPLADGEAVYLRAEVAEGARVRFAYSLDGERFEPVGAPFQARQGRWIGAKIGLFALRPAGTSAGGYVDVDFFEIAPR